MAKTELARRILTILRDEQAEEGFHLREQWLADALGVSRSPVRTALKQLEQLKVVRSEPNQGYFLRSPPGSAAFDEIELPEGETDRIYRRIASERFANLIGDQVSVGDLVRRYDVSRAAILKVLARMQEDGLVEKTPGHGWVFGPSLNDEAAYQESYRYRLLIEPAALTEDGFHLPPRKIASLRDLHQSALDEGLETRSIGELFDIDAAFHETLGNACGNRFLIQAIRQQTRLRRLSEYEKYTSRDRHAQSFGEHLSILDAIATGDRALAAERMRAHILAANEKRPDFRKVRTLAHRRLTRR